MPEFKVNRFRVETLGRVFGTRAFVSALDAAIPLAHEQAQRALLVWSEENAIDAAEYSNERQMLDEWYGWWAPRLATYSALIAIHSLVEAELFACGDRIASQRPGVVKAKRRGLEHARAYLHRLTDINVGTDEAWKDLLRLEELRNIAVHRGGGVEDSKDKQIVERLQGNYKGQLWVAERSELHDRYLHVAPTLCTRFADLAEAMFRRLMIQLDQ